MRLLRYRLWKHSPDSSMKRKVKEKLPEMWMTTAAAALLLMSLAACKQGEGSGMPFQTVGRQPDVAPVMLNKELPFRYPPALYAQKVQGNVTLRIFIDREGAIVPDSTRIAETSDNQCRCQSCCRCISDIRMRRR
jgi:hypothetical protein